MYEIKYRKRAKKMNFRFVGKISQKRLKKSLLLHQFSLFFVKKALFEISHQIKGNNLTKSSKVLLPKRGSKSDTFSLFFRNLFRLSVQYFASDFPNWSIFWDGISEDHLPDVDWKNMFFHQNHQISHLHFVNAPYESAPTFGTLWGWNPVPPKTWDTFCAKMTKTFRFLAKNV